MQEYAAPHGNKIHVGRKPPGALEERTKEGVWQTL